MSKKDIRTIAIHGGYNSDPTTGAIAVPIYQTSAFTFDSAEQASNRFALKEGGFIYGRINNPTNDIFEKRMAEIEGGIAALSLASGQSASLFSVLNLAKTGDNIVASQDLYGGTRALFSYTLKNMGIEVRYANSDNPENFKALCDNNTKCIYAETLPNPSLNTFPIEEVANIAHEIGIPLIMDNTCSPLICKPFDFGADIVLHSATKYIGGQGNSIAGIVIDKGDFPYQKHQDRFPLMNEAEQAYHGTVWTKDFDKLAYITRMRAMLLRDMGACLSPFNSFLMLNGIETLPLRIKAHCENATAIAKELLSHSAIERVIHPSVMTGLYKERADKYLGGQYGALMGIDLKGGREKAKQFIENLKMLKHAANLGDTRSLAVHPASTTHSQLTDAELINIGITPGYVRLSIGIEASCDILADIVQALE